MFIVATTIENIESLTYAAAQRDAMMHSLSSACKAHRANPSEWLCDVFAKLPKSFAQSNGGIAPKPMGSKRNPKTARHIIAD
ncbi:MAG: hypothetical protein CRN43_06015 [Candidatus Nephrothrix sp. EaCA]|nr:MAG: hypothetical protein CRN43_06015 [Candidatus Nephrothrix sp. EaCA]